MWRIWIWSLSHFTLAGVTSEKINNFFYLWSSYQWTVVKISHEIDWRDVLVLTRQPGERTPENLAATHYRRWAAMFSHTHTDYHRPANLCSFIFLGDYYYEKLYKRRNKSFHKKICFFLMTMSIEYFCHNH